MPTALPSRCARVAVLVLVLAGCASQPAGTRAGTPALTPAAGDLIARTGTYYQDQHLLKTTENTLSDACMAAAGFPVTTTEQIRADEEWRPVRAERQQSGYRLRTSEDAESTSPAAAYVRSLPADRQAAFQVAMSGGDADRAAITLRGGSQYSFSTRGCVAEARGRVYGDPAQAARVDYLAQEYHNAGYLKVIAEPAYATALGAWRECMAAAGHDYASPAEAKRSLAGEYGPGAPKTASRHEIEVAVADAECATRAGVGGTVESLLRAYAERLDETGIRELNALAVLRQEAVTRARTLTAG